MSEQTSHPLRRDALTGARAMLPILISIVPFALITGVVAARLDLSWVTAIGLSLLVFAGASQLAAMQLIYDGAPVAIILLTVFFINLRFTMYSASIAPYFRGASAPVKALISYLLTDQAYMVSLYGFEQRKNSRSRRIAFFLGAAATLWLGWQVATVAGVLLGSKLPSGWGLDFGVPLTFLALLVPAIVDRATVVAAIVGGVAAVLAHGLPWNIGLIIGGLAGVVAGLATGTALPPRARTS